MNSENAQYLFAYGTLRSTHRQHREFCPNALSVRPARVLGALYALKEGYPILIVPLDSKRQSATPDCCHDWSSARSKALPTSIKPEAGLGLIEGELIELPLESNALAKPDAWEGFQVGQETTYRRFIVPALLADETIVPCWVYAALQPPEQSRAIKSKQWTPQS